MAGGEIEKEEPIREAAPELGTMGGEAREEERGAEGGEARREGKGEEEVH